MANLLYTAGYLGKEAAEGEIINVARRAGQVLRRTPTGHLPELMPSGRLLSWYKKELEGTEEGWWEYQKQYAKELQMTPKEFIPQAGWAGSTPLISPYAERHPDVPRWKIARAQIKVQLKESPVTIACWEALPEKCHRALAASLMGATGIPLAVPYERPEFLSLFKKASEHIVAAEGEAREYAKKAGISLEQIETIGKRPGSSAGSASNIEKSIGVPDDSIGAIPPPAYERFVEIYGQRSIQTARAAAKKDILLNAELFHEGIRTPLTFVNKDKAFQIARHRGIPVVQKVGMTSPNDMIAAKAISNVGITDASRQALDTFAEVTIQQAERQGIPRTAFSHVDAQVTVPRPPLRSSIVSSSAADSETLASYEAMTRQGTRPVPQPMFAEMYDEHEMVPMPSLNVSAPRPSVGEFQPTVYTTPPLQGTGGPGLGEETHQRAFALMDSYGLDSLKSDRQPIISMAERKPPTQVPYHDVRPPGVAMAGGSEQFVQALTQHMENLPKIVPEVVEQGAEASLDAISHVPVHNIERQHMIAEEAAAGYIDKIADVEAQLVSLPIMMDKSGLESIGPMKWDPVACQTAFDVMERAHGVSIMPSYVEAAQFSPANAMRVSDELSGGAWQDIQRGTRERPSPVVPQDIVDTFHEEGPGLSMRSISKSSLHANVEKRDVNVVHAAEPL